jgi:anti-sigma factor RsiW
MRRELRPEEIDELLGAYALDAVDGDERAAVERRLLDDPRARAEVADHRAVAALLASTGGPAPTGVWDRIAAALEDEQPPAFDMAPFAPPAAIAPVVPLAPRSRSSAAAVPSQWNRWAAGAVAAAMFAGLVGLTATVVGQNQTISEMRDDLSAAQTGGIAAEATNAMSDPTSRRAILTSETGGRMDAVIEADGTGFLLASSLPDLAEGRTYQLWGVMEGDGGDVVVSLGVLGGNPGVATFEAAGTVKTLVITEEARGGVVSSEQPALMAGDVI